MGCSLALLLAGPMFLQASGTYQSRLPRPPVKKATTDHGDIDNEKYGRGKKVYSGKISNQAAPAPESAAQAAQLKQWSEQLPKSKQAQALPQLAGKLSQREMDALGYYLKTRYNLK